MHQKGFAGLSRAAAEGPRRAAGEGGHPSFGAVSVRAEHLGEAEEPFPGRGKCAL